jgi:uncharacterized protein (TIGR02001 family)
MDRCAFSILALLTTSLLSLPAIAAEPAAPASDSFFAGKFAGSFGFFSNYVFRGITQTSDAPAVQGNIDYVFDNGLKFGVWGSNVDFSDASSEFDVYAAYTQTVDSWTGEVGAVYYYYPGTADVNDIDYGEIYASLGYDFGVASLTGSVNYSPDFTGGTGEAWYSRLYGKVPLPYDLALDGWVGYQSVEKNSVLALPDYTDWALGLAYTYETFTLKGQYTDTDISTAECGGVDNCDAKGIVSVVKAF